MGCLDHLEAALDEEKARPPTSERLSDGERETGGTHRKGRVLGNW